MGLIGDKNMSTTTTKETARAQTKRIPFGTPRTRLSLNTQLEGFHYRWVNDQPGRLSQAQEGGYSFAEPAEVGKEPTENNRVFELVGLQKDGVNPLYAYLMKIPKEWYLEDDKVKQSQLDQIDAAIKGGKADDGNRENRYIPTAGISIK